MSGKVKKMFLIVIIVYSIFCSVALISRYDDICKIPEAAPANYPYFFTCVQDSIWEKYGTRISYNPKYGNKDFYFKDYYISTFTNQLFPEDVGKKEPLSIMTLNFSTEDGSVSVDLINKNEILIIKDEPDFQIYAFHLINGVYQSESEGGNLRWLNTALQQLAMIKEDISPIVNQVSQYYQTYKIGIFKQKCLIYILGEILLLVVWVALTKQEKLKE